MTIIKKYPKNRGKNLRCLKKIRVGSIKVGLVGFPETRHLSFLPKEDVQLMTSLEFLPRIMLNMLPL